MSKYLKKFSQHSQYENFIGGGESEFILPNVSHCVQENHVHYNPKRYYITCTYNVTDDTQPTLIYHYYTYEGYENYWVKGVDLFDKVEIDGVETSIADLDAAEGKYQLSAGEHTVKYALKDPTSIDRPIFGVCNNITRVEIPNSITSICDDAFSSCQNLTSVSIPNSVKSIDYGAFSDSYIQNLYIDTTVVDVWFSEHTTIESITLGNNVKTVVDGAFCSCFNVNDNDKSIIENFNDKAFCETYCIMATYPESSQKAVLGSALAYYIDGVKIPNDEIIME